MTYPSQAERAVVAAIRRSRIAAQRPGTDLKHPTRPAQKVYVGQTHPTTPVIACSECVLRLISVGYVVAKAAK